MIRGHADMAVIPGQMLARLTIMAAFQGCEDIEFYCQDGKGAVRYFRYTDGQTDEYEQIFTQDKKGCRKLQAVLDFPEPIMEGEEMLGCDGVTYTLTLFKNGTKMTWSWWCDAPKGWEAVVKASNALLKAAKVNDRVRIRQAQ